MAAQSNGAQKTMKTTNTGVAQEEITFGGGCFWCTEAIFEEVRGVQKVESGYAGGSVINPTYEDVCSGRTGHAEVVQIVFNPEIISLEKILQIFFATHDPTTPNRQGADIGTQYRSVIFYRNIQQKETVDKVIGQLKKLKAYKQPIVTQVVPLQSFYRAEDYHQDYFQRNPEQSYCRIIINPKLEKFRKVFRDNLKK
ncbi:MAG: peptide-methionine (S)-S-oxide reductase [Deltaproteobacteria bacterium HGW-Deltaproteobacteria-12]|jgi:peptide-methionine (S)-S-oxide reductase|nr:MAG: peptide-methionine (S)-S-oxide reductase [Deltaproteobacteria bacterium HGW-Deltaproteobacteria-12]